MTAHSSCRQIFCYMSAYKHGFSSRDYKGVKRQFYNRWQNMKTRCFNPNRKDWKNYGKRGITINPEWLDFDTFRKDMYRSFLRHYSKYGLKNTTLDRINPNKNYSRKNCRWATKHEQGQTTRKTKMIRYRNNIYSINQLCQIFDRSPSTIHSRIIRGIPLDKPYRAKATKTL